MFEGGFGNDRSKSALNGDNPRINAVSEYPYNRTCICMGKHIEIYFYKAERIALQVTREIAVRVGEQQSEVVQVGAWSDEFHLRNREQRHFSRILCNQSHR